MFRSGDGDDTIEGFVPGEDLIDLRSHADARGIDDVHVSADARGAVVAVGTDTITLLGVDADALGSGDFLV